MYATNAGWDATYEADEYVDEDVLRDEDNYGREPRCGGPRCDYDENVGCPGCRHCLPPDHECKPYGFGIERWEDAALMRCHRASRPCLEIGLLNEATYRELMERSRTTYSARREKLSRIVWDRVCDRAETHSEAVDAYKAFARRVVKVRFRDDK